MFFSGWVRQLLSSLLPFLPLTMETKRQVWVEKGSAGTSGNNDMTQGKTGLFHARTPTYSVPKLWYKMLYSFSLAQVTTSQWHDYQKTHSPKQKSWFCAPELFVFSSQTLAAATQVKSRWQNATSMLLCIEVAFGVVLFGSMFWQLIYPL